MITQLKIPQQIKQKLNLSQNTLKVRIDSRVSSNRVRAIIPMEMAPIDASMLGVRMTARLEIDLADDTNNDLLDGTNPDAEDWATVVENLYDQSHDNLALSITGPEFDGEDYPEGYDENSLDFSNANVDRAEDDQVWFNSGYSIVDIPVNIKFTADDGTLTLNKVDYGDASPVSIEGKINGDDTSVADVDVDVNPYDAEVLDQAAVTPVTIDPPYKTVHFAGTTDTAEFNLEVQDIDINLFDAKQINKVIASNVEPFADDLLKVDAKAN